MLGGGGVHFVLHLEHDGDVFRAVFRVAEDEVSLGAVRGIVVFLEVGGGHHGAEHLVEQGGAVYLECLAHHLGAHARLQVLVVFHLFLLHLQLVLVAFYQFVFADLCLASFQLGIVLQTLYLLFFLLDDVLRLVLFFQQGYLQVGFMLPDGGIQRGDGLVLGSECNGAFVVLLRSDALQLLLEACYFGLLGGEFLRLAVEQLLEVLFRLGGCQLLFGLVTGVHFGHPSAEFGFEFLVLHLVQYGYIVGFVHREDASALGAFQFLHIYIYNRCFLFLAQR